MIWRHLTVAQRAALVIVAVLAALTAGDGLLHAALAQAPVSVPRKAPEPAGGVIGWVLAQQSEFYRAMSAAVRAAKNDGSAVWTLLGIAFAYGIFHAAGPGHGKAVISSYLVANEETARRGIALSFVSALLQALVAVVLVGVCAWLLNVTAQTMCGAEKAIEIASYGLIAAFGARLVWTKGGGFVRALRARAPNRRLRRGISIMVITTMIMMMAMCMMSIAGIRMGRRRISLPVPAAGGAGSVPSSPSACAPVRARSWCWCSRWRRACSGLALPPLSRWVSAPPSPLRPSRSSPFPPRDLRSGSLPAARAAAR